MKYFILQLIFRVVVKIIERLLDKKEIDDDQVKTLKRSLLSADKKRTRT